jgi:PAS domain S-box-containing protein
MGNEQILVVDDEPLMVQTCAQILVEQGYQVHEAYGGQEALTWLGEERFDCVVTDLWMPDVDGWTVLRRARELDPSIAAVAITSYDTLKNAIEALRAGAHDFLVKPFEPDDLLLTVDKVLAARRREQERLLLRARLPILEISQALMADGDVETLAGRLLDVAVEQIGAEGAALLLLDQEANELWVAAAVPPDRKMAEMRVPAGEGIARAALQRQEPLLLEAPLPASPDPLRPTFAAGPGIAAVCVPLRTGEKAIGLLTLSRAERAGRAPFSPSDLNLLSIMGRQIDTALENARLVEALRRELEERKRAEEALRESRDYLVRLTNSMWDAVLSVRMPERVIEWANDSFRLIGYEPEECVGRTTEFLYSDRNEFLDFGNKLKKAFRAGKDILHAEQSLRRKTGEVFPAEITTTIFKERGEVAHVTSIVRDITERKRAEKVLRDSEERYRSLFERVPVGLYRTTLEGQILDINPALLEMLGFPDRETALAVNVADGYANPEDRTRWQALMDREGVVRDFEAQWRRHDGTIIWVKESARAVRDAEGQVLYYEGAVEDITERKRTEEALHRSLEETARGQRLLLALSQAAQAVQRARTPDEVYRTVLDQVAGLGYHAAILEPSADQAHLTVSHVALEPALQQAGEQLIGIPALGYRIPLVPGDLVQRTLAEGKTTFVARPVDYLADLLPEAMRPLAGRLADLLGLEQGIVAPLTVGNETDSLLAVIGAGLTEADVPAVSAFASQAAAALENARLYKAEQERRHIAETLRQASTILSSTLDLNETLGLILQQLRQVIPYDTTSIQLLHENALRIAACQGFARPDKVVGLVFPLNPKFPNYRVVTTKAPLAIEDISQEYPHFRDEMDVYESGSIRSWLGVPLQVKDQVIGMVALDRQGVHPFTAEETQLAMSFASQAAIALENARLVEEVRTRSTHLEELSARLFRAQEEERRSLALELHDEIGQALTLVKIKLQAAQRSCDTAPAPHLEEGIGIVDRTLQQVRNLSLDLRPSLLDDLGLVPALRWYVDRQTQQAGFVARFAADPLEKRLSPHLEIACFRIVQEALTNAIRHAQAQQVHIELRHHEDKLQLSIRDDGTGFDVPAALQRAARGASLGLLGLQERILSLGGQVEIESTPGHGTEIRACFPLTLSAEVRDENGGSR